MKSGTTWFYESCVNSKDIFAPPVKETRILSTFDRFGKIDLLSKLSKEQDIQKNDFKKHQIKTFLEYPKVFVKQFSLLFSQIGSERLAPNAAIQFEWWLKYLSHTWTPKIFNTLSRVHEKRFSLDASPCNLIISQKTISLLKKEVPDPKIIVLLRNPFRRLYSSLCMDLEWKIALEKYKLSELLLFSNNEKNCTHLKEMLAHSFVVEGLNRWRLAFSDNRIFVIILEELSQHHEEIQNHLNKFLGINSLELKKNIVNSSNSYQPSQAAKQFLLPILENTHSACSKVLNIKLPFDIGDENKYETSQIQSGILKNRKPDRPKSTKTSQV